MSSALRHRVAVTVRTVDAIQRSKTGKYAESLNPDGPREPRDKSRRLGRPITD
jgi:hypothetical protein